MIAADTSTWVAYLEGVPGNDTLSLDQALRDRQLVMVPVVLTELLSDPKLPAALAATTRDRDFRAFAESSRSLLTLLP